MLLEKLLLLFFFNNFIYLFLTVPCLPCCTGFSLATVQRFLIAVASLVRHGL